MPFDPREAVDNQPQRLFAMDVGMVKAAIARFICQMIGWIVAVGSLTRLAIAGRQRRRGVGVGSGHGVG